MALSDKLQIGRAILSALKEDTDMRLAGLEALLDEIELERPDNYYFYDREDVPEPELITLDEFEHQPILFADDIDVPVLTNFDEPCDILPLMRAEQSEALIGLTTYR